MSIFKNILYKRPSIRIAVRYSATVGFVILLFAILVPRFLNYGPESINTPFDIQMSYIPYWLQFLCIGLLLVFLIIITTCFLFKEIDKFYLSDDPKKYNNTKLINKVRKKCFSLPYSIPICEVLIPAISALFVLLLTGSHLSIMLVKILILVFAFSIILAVLSFIFSKGIFNEILTKTYRKNSDNGLRINLKSKILLQVLPLLIFCIIIIAFLGYSYTVREKENVYYNIYNQTISETFNKDGKYTYDSIYKKLDSIELYDNSHSKFIVKPDKSVVTLQGEAPSDFLVEYTIQIAQNHDGKTYDSYGVDTQGKTMKLSASDGDYYVGIIYNIGTNNSIWYLLICGTALFLVSACILYIFSASLSNDISQISNNFDKLCSNEFGRTLPITSNDEIGDLIHSFNSVQKYSKNQLDLIKNNQEVLMEQERLATLGQMVGGIAHNLKTPIMSISGATEGLKDLINEYEASVGDSEVTVEDHHDIAKDMKNWVSKIDSYTEYMSDIITAVKGQAVTLSNQEIVTFTLNELVKRVNILMKHELKNSLINLNINMNVDDQLVLNGDINSLVQVLNNLISNAIQSYEGAENKNIDLDFNKVDNNLIISVTDYGKGIPEEIQEKLFKQMITTKGKNGTGLGLFMSYSNIRAHFNGNMRFESHVGKGTCFEIILPI